MFFVLEFYFLPRVLFRLGVYEFRYIALFVVVCFFSRGQTILKNSCLILFHSGSISILKTIFELHHQVWFGLKLYVYESNFFWSGVFTRSGLIIKTKFDVTAFKKSSTEFSGSFPIIIMSEVILLRLLFVKK